MWRRTGIYVELALIVVDPYPSKNAKLPGNIPEYNKPRKSKGYKDNSKSKNKALVH